MKNPIIGLCTLELYLPGVLSLKEKRSIIKSMLARLRNTFNVSTAEIDHHDVWQSAGIAIVTVSGSTVHARQVVSKTISWIEEHFPDVMIVRQEVEVL